MPNVGGKKYPYTPAGKAAAKKAAAKKKGESVASKYVPLKGKPAKGGSVMKAKGKKTVNPPFKPTTRPAKRGR